jgi:hypothetical protein
MPVIRGADGWSLKVTQDPAYVERVTTWTYAIATSSRVKIGRTTMHPSQRLADLQTANAEELHLLGYTAHLSEARAHKLYRRQHVRGEWFRWQVIEELLDWDWLDTRAVRELLRNAFTLSPRR